MKDTILSFADASWLSLQVYAIAIVVSMVVALVIKLLVVATSATAKSAPKPVAQVAPKPVVAAGISQEVVAAISGALAVATGPHRILHIAPSSHAWSSQGRGAQHSHNVKR